VALPLTFFGLGELKIQKIALTFGSEVILFNLQMSGVDLDVYSGIACCQASGCSMPNGGTVLMSL
jgi:hypothetical protein